MNYSLLLIGLVLACLCLFCCCCFSSLSAAAVSGSKSLGSPWTKHSKMSCKPDFGGTLQGVWEFYYQGEERLAEPGPGTTDINYLKEKCLSLPDCKGFDYVEFVAGGVTYSSYQLFKKPPLGYTPHLKIDGITETDNSACYTVNR